MLSHGELVYEIWGHYLFRICAEHTCQQWSAQGPLLPISRVAELVSKPGKRFYGHVRLWQEDHIETNLSAYWEPTEEEALLVISDLPACRKRITEYRSEERRTGVSLHCS